MPNNPRQFTRLPSSNSTSTRGKGQRYKHDYQKCSRCSHYFNAARGRCTSCLQWAPPLHLVTSNPTDGTITLDQAGDDKPVEVIKTGVWDKCFSLQGGIAIDSVTLVGGEPGAGKSTLSLQLSNEIAKTKKREVLYVGTEESGSQTADRARRLKLSQLRLIRLFPMNTQSDLGDVIMARKPCAIIVDSLDGMHSDPAEHAEIAKTLKSYADLLKSPVILVSHITKDGDFAGFMKLQHYVDTTILFTLDEGIQGERESEGEPIRKVETVKNRYGPLTSCLLQMTQRGLKKFVEAEEGGDDDDED